MALYADHMRVQMDTKYVPALIETRQVYGVSLEQRRNDAKISAETFTNIVSKNKDVSVKVAWYWALDSSC